MKSIIFIYFAGDKSRILPVIHYLLNLYNNPVGTVVFILMSSVVDFTTDYLLRNFVMNTLTLLMCVT
jgi:hypothetical protein